MTTPTIGQTLTTTVHQTRDFVQKHLQPILLGAVIFGALNWGVSYALIGRQANMWAEKMGTHQQAAEEWGKKMEDLGGRMQRGEFGDVTDEQAQEMARGAAMEGMQAAGLSGGMLGGLMAGAGLTFLITMIISVIAKAYYTLIAVKGMKDVGETFNVSLKWAWPLFLLSIWIALRSFIWIPIIGFIIAIFLFPRFILAPIFLLEQGKGVMESAKMSYEKTKNDWLRILAVGLVIGVCTIIIMMIIGVVLGALGPMVGGVLRSMLSQIVSAVMMIAMILLGRSILAQPAVAAPVTPTPAV
jgi:hypothetical protein